MCCLYSLLEELHGTHEARSGLWSMPALPSFCPCICGHGPHGHSDFASPFLSHQVLVVVNSNSTLHGALISQSAQCRLWNTHCREHCTPHLFSAFLGWDLPWSLRSPFAPPDSRQELVHPKKISQKGREEVWCSAFPAMSVQKPTLDRLADHWTIGLQNFQVWYLISTTKATTKRWLVSSFQITTGHFIRK